MSQLFKKKRLAGSILLSRICFLFLLRTIHKGKVHQWIIWGRRLNFHVGKNKIHYHCPREHLEVGETAKFGHKVIKYDKCRRAKLAYIFIMRGLSYHT